MGCEADPVQLPPTVEELFAHTRVSADIDFSFTLACFESLARDRGRELTQAKVMAIFAGEFPKWDERPGLIDNKEELRKLAAITSLSNNLVKLRNTVDVKPRFNPDKAGVLLAALSAMVVGILVFAPHLIKLQRP